MSLVFLYSPTSNYNTFVGLKTIVPAINLDFHFFFLRLAHKVTYKYFSCAIIVVLVMVEHVENQGWSNRTAFSQIVIPIMPFCLSQVVEIYKKQEK